MLRKGEFLQCCLIFGMVISQQIIPITEVQIFVWISVQNSQQIEARWSVEDTLKIEQSGMDCVISSKHYIIGPHISVAQAIKAITGNLTFRSGAIEQYGGTTVDLRSDVRQFRRQRNVINYRWRCILEELAPRWFFDDSRWLKLFSNQRLLEIR